MRIPIEFTERPYPFSRRGVRSPAYRRIAPGHEPEEAWESPPWADEPEDLRAAPREAAPEEKAPRPDAWRREALKPEPSAPPPEAEARFAREEPPEEAQSWRERFVRLKADLENVRRHADAERARLANQGKDALLDDIFPIVDHLQRATEAARRAGGDAGVLRGIEMVYDEFLSVLEKHGVKKIRAVGRPFDPRVHDAVAVRAHPDARKDTVVDEVRNGFTRGDTLLRPAHVVVAA